MPMPEQETAVSFSANSRRDGQA